MDKCKCGTPWSSMLYGNKCAICSEVRPIPQKISIFNGYEVKVVPVGTQFMMPEGLVTMDNNTVCLIGTVICLTESSFNAIKEHLHQVEIPEVYQTRKIFYHHKMPYRDIKEEKLMAAMAKISM